MFSARSLAHHFMRFASDSRSSNVRQISRINRLYSTPTTLNTIPGVHHNLQEKEPGITVATVTVSNPKKLNIVDSSLLEHLVETCRTISSIESLRVVVLTGGTTAAGKRSSFIGGADIGEMHALSHKDDAKAFINRVHTACQAIREIPVPVIARVNGLCLGAGLEIMASCDLRIATEESTFAMPEVKVGIPSVVEAALLPSLIGMGRTRRLLYLAESISASTAERWGLVERLVHDETALDLAVSEWLAILVGMGPKAIRAQKALMRKWENSTTDAAIEAGIEAYSSAYVDGGDEPKEYMGRFLSRKR